jgi:hypothetical protein
MAHERAVRNISALFLALPVIGAAQFILANIAGLHASLLFGATAIVCWGIGLGAVMAAGGIFTGLPRRGLAFFVPFALWTLWLSSMPPYFRDDLIIHLAYPKYLLQAGKWVFIPFQPGTASPNLLVPLNMVLVDAGLDWAVSFLPALFSLATALILAHWTARERGGAWGLFAAAALLTIPVFFRLSTTAYNDPAVMFFSCAGTFYFYRFMDGADVRNGVFGAALFAAGSAIKYNAGFLLAVMLVGLLFQGRRDMKKYATVAVAAVVAAALFCGPWWFAYARAGSPAITAAPMFKGPMAERMAICGDSALWALASPARIFFEGKEGSSCAYDGTLNPLLLIFGLLAAIVPWRRPGYRFLAGSALLYMVFSSLLFSITARYFLPIMPLLVFLSAAFLAEASVRGFLRAALAAAALAIAVNAWGYMQSAREFDGWGYLLGRESKNDFLSRNVAPFGASVFADENLNRGDTIYFVFMGNQVYYTGIKYYYDSFWDGTTLMRLFAKSRDAGGICLELKQMGLTHLLYRKDMMEKFIAQNGLQAVAADFNEKCSRTLYEDRGARLVALGSKGAF